MKTKLLFGALLAFNYTQAQAANPFCDTVEIIAQSSQEMRQAGATQDESISALRTAINGTDMDYDLKVVIKDTIPIVVNNTYAVFDTWDSLVSVGKASKEACHNLLNEEENERWEP